MAESRGSERPAPRPLPPLPTAAPLATGEARRVAAAAAFCPECQLLGRTSAAPRRGKRLCSLPGSPISGTPGTWRYASPEHSSLRPPSTTRRSFCPHRALATPALPAGCRPPRHSHWAGTPEAVAAAWALCSSDSILRQCPGAPAC
ncbi:uncharacterized protein PHA67_009182 isoform 1-T2 [Liasis olivaceus]